MMEKLNICIDIDGTVTEPYYWLTLANKYFNTNVKPKDITVYEIEGILGITQEAYDRFYDLYGETMHRESAVRPGVKEVISKLHDYHNIHFVTARHERMRNVSLEWMSRHRIPMDSISFLGSHNKINRARELSSDIFIEDRYENAISLSRAGFDVLLIDCSYNKGILPANVKRVGNWSQIFKIISNSPQQLDNLYKPA